MANLECNVKCTHLVVLVVAGATVFIKAQGSVISDQIRMKFGRIVLCINMHRLKGVDFMSLLTQKSAAIW